MSTVDLSGLTWRKSSRSGGNNDNTACVEIAFSGHAVAVRDCKSRAAGTLAFPRRLVHRPAAPHLMLWPAFAEQAPELARRGSRVKITVWAGKCLFSSTFLPNQRS